MINATSYTKSFGLFIAAGLFYGVTAQAQDTLRRRSVEVTSTFKPTLKEAAKINFNAAPPNTDTTRPRLQYTIPNQNLLFGFQPGSLKPLALQVDSGGVWNNENYVKAGFGSLRTPFLQAGLSIGDGKTTGVNLYAKHTSSKGRIPFQNFSQTNFDLNAFMQTSKNIEWNGRFGGVQERYNKYGFQPKDLTFPQDSLEVRYQTWRGRVAFHNINRTSLGLSYSPEIKIDVFNDQLSNTESNTYVHLPLQKTVGENFAVDLALEANLSRYKPEEKREVNNNYVSVAPSVLYKSPNLNIQAGIRPSWDNSAFRLLPNIMAEFSSTDKRVSFQLGWVGYLRNSGFRYQANINPWIWAPETVFNSRIEERYAGFKGSVGDHFSYGAKVGYHKITNQPLFVNDTSSGKSFMVLNEPELDVLHFGGEMGFNIGERFSLITNLTANKYRNLKENDRPWGLLPLEFRTSMRIQVLKDLYVTSDLYAFDGAWYRTKGGDAKRAQGALDLSAGVEFAVVKNIKVWAQFNNILNREYQRWNQYPVYGFNFLGGVVFSFAQNNK